MSCRRRKTTKTIVGVRTLIALAIAGCLVALLVKNSHTGSATHAESSSDAIDQAIYTRQEFFGAEAIVPLPTAEANRLFRLRQTSPNDSAIIEKLSEIEEKLGNYDAAEQDLKQLVAIDRKYSKNLSVFYDRRGRYRDEAAQLRLMLSTSEVNERPAIFEDLVNVVRTHDLQEYLRPEFYHEVVSQNSNVYDVLDRLIEQLTNDEELDEALKYVRLAKNQFSAQKSALLQKEIKLLERMGKEKEAVKVYITAFDPFWSTDENEKFYQYLSDNDRLRDYTSSIKTRFEQNPADFDAAIRLAHYRCYRTQDPAAIFTRLEKAKNSWTTDELLTVTRFLLQQHDLPSASRYLYTLYNRPEVKAGGEARTRVLYQLFKIFSDAENHKLPITKGDLDYYRQIATIDTDPGIATGILSLLFSDTDPAGQLGEKEQVAAGYFNRAAAYRIFLAYKKENSTSPELAEMYLDIVRLYTKTEQNDIAIEALDEFASRYKRSNDFRAVALKLADAYSERKDIEKTRSIYREVLASYEGQDIDNASPGRRPENAPDTKILDAFSDDFQPVAYSEVLGRLINSFAKDKQTTEILQVYSKEITRHPDAEWLYEARLNWLDQTNLTDEQLAAYRQALDKFQTTSWRDKLARWFLRKDREADFEQFSTDLVAKLDEGETQGYLAQFVDAKMTARDFEKELYLRLYLSALKRFPHNDAFVTGLLNFYAANKREDNWRKLAATYYFEMPQVRKLFISHLAEKNELRNYLAAARSDSAVYKLFRADASISLSEFETAAGHYRELNEIYPNTAEFSETLITLDRSLGQKDIGTLTESAELAGSRAEFDASFTAELTRSGEIYAELGDLKRSREQWDKLIDTATGDKETYLKTATVFWDYFQYHDALRVIAMSRKKFGDEKLCSFEAGAIDESLHDKPAAIREYIKSLGSDDEQQTYKAVGRLVKLTNANRLGGQIAAAFTAEHSHSGSRAAVALGYANYLVQIDKQDEAEKLLSSEIAARATTSFWPTCVTLPKKTISARSNRVALKEAV